MVKVGARGGLSPRISDLKSKPEMTFQRLVFRWFDCHVEQ